MITRPTFGRSVATKDENQPRPFPTSWARTLPVRGLREIVQQVGLQAIMKAEVSIEVHGLEELEGFDGPAVIVANHSSHLDTALLLCTLPNARRRRTAVAAAADYFFESWWSGVGSTIAFNTFPVDRQGGGLSATPAALLADGWSVLWYPEGTRSPDGYMGRFRLGAAWLAAEAGVPIIPVGLRGTFAAMPKGRSWPVPGRPRVSIRYGAPIVPEPGDTARQLAPKISAAVKQLIAEDKSTWWESQRAITPAEENPPPASWRRIWQQTASPAQGGKLQRPKIWRK